MYYHRIILRPARDCLNYENLVEGLRGRHTRICCLRLTHVYDIHKTRLCSLSRTCSILVLE